MYKNLEYFQKGMYLLPKEGGMKVPGLIVGNESLFNAFDMEEPLKQVKNVAHLPGIVGYSIAMPDMHWGYGFPIGGVAAFDERGVISPGGVGYDINCGVRLAIVPIAFDDIPLKKRKQLLDTLFAMIPSGVGHGVKTRKPLTVQDYKKLLIEGSSWSISQGMGFAEDLDSTESHGRIGEADFHAVSEFALKRGESQLGSIGSGNHFVEIGKVDKLFLPNVAEAWGIFQGQTYILIHSGSRGFGYQVCQDTLQEFIKQGYHQGLPDRQLVVAPLKSPAGQKYWQAMAAAANYAFNNRQHILHEVRQAFNKVLGISQNQVKMVYDVCHNIAKMETYVIKGVKKRLCVHRKGATRALGPGSQELGPKYQKTGQPVLVPGDMGRASHVMAGLGNELTFCSCCHGAGRARSRMKSMDAWKDKDLKAYLADKGVEVKASSFATVAEEMPDAYKDVDDVVDAVEEAGLARKVARLTPHLVMKG